MVGASLDVMDRDARHARRMFTNMRSGEGLDAVVDFIKQTGGLASAA